MYVPTAYIQYSTYTTRLTYITLYTEMGGSQHPEHQVPQKITFAISYSSIKIIQYILEFSRLVSDQPSFLDTRITKSLSLCVMDDPQYTKLLSMTAAFVRHRLQGTWHCSVLDRLRWSSVEMFSSNSQQ